MFVADEKERGNATPQKIRRMLGTFVGASFGALAVLSPAALTSGGGGGNTVTLFSHETSVRNCEKYRSSPHDVTPVFRRTPPPPCRRTRLGGERRGEGRDERRGARQVPPSFGRREEVFTIVVPDVVVPSPHLPADHSYEI